MAKFLMRKTPTGFKFDLKAGNGEVIATSEVYSSEGSCQKGIDSVKVNAPIANLEDQTADPLVTALNPKFEMYKDKAGEFRFRLKAKNGNVIATSEGYKAMKSCQNGIDSVRKNAPEATLQKDY